MVEMFRRLGSGQIKILFNSTVNPGQSNPYAWVSRQAMGQAIKGTPWPLVITFESFPSATTQVSDIVLSASSWSEKEYLYGNLERRYQLIKHLIPPHKDSIPDHTLTAIIARRLEEEGIVPKGLVSRFWPEEFDGQDWLKKTLTACKTKDWNTKFTAKVWDDILQCVRGTAYDFTGMRRSLLHERNWGFRQPMPEDYHTNPDVRKRYEKYESRIQYAYPYDPMVEKRFETAVANLKKWNPVYGSWIEKQIREEMKDSDYHHKESLPAGWFLFFYSSNAWLHGMVDDPTRPGAKLPVIDGRAIAWANPWWACKLEGNKFVKYRTVEIIERVFNPKKVDENSALPFDIRARYTVNVPGDPDKDLNALKLIALSPAEFPGLRCAYRRADGTEIVIYDTREFPYGACTGRVLEHWHTATMTGRVPQLARAVPGAYVEINEELARKLRVKTGDIVVVESRRGKIELPVKVLNVTQATGGPRKDYIFIPWFDELKLINMIMPDFFDPFSFQPDYKLFAVKIYKGRTKTRQAEPGRVVA